VLDYLRANKVCLPATVYLNALEDNFEYYGIDVDMSNVIASTLRSFQEPRAEMVTINHPQLVERVDRAIQFIKRVESQLASRPSVRRITIGLFFNHLAFDWTVWMMNCFLRAFVKGLKAGEYVKDLKG
jgi:hypothetical protein